MPDGTIGVVPKTTNREPAPNREWVLMYRNGLPRRRIAKLADVPAHIVSYNLRLARAADPELRSAHEESAKAKEHQVTERGNDWPRHKAIITGEEHELGVWLHTQRYKQRRGELDAKKAAALDKAVPGWRVGSKRGHRRPWARELRSSDGVAGRRLYLIWLARHS